MTRALHELIEKAVKAAPIWDWANTGVDIPAELFDVLIEEGAAEGEASPGGATTATITLGGSRVWIFARGPPDA